MTQLRSRLLWTFCFLGLLLAIPAASQAQQEPTVRAVLFYSPTCPHCHAVINDLLLPMVEEHGDRLQIVAVDVTQHGGQALYQAAIQHFAIPEERRGVPTLIVADVVLVGANEIPGRFPAIVRDGLASGIDWPAIPGFVPPSETAETSPTATMTAVSETATNPTVTEPRPTLTPSPAATSTAPATTEATAVAVLDPSNDQAQPPDESGTPLILDGAGPEIALEEPDDPPADPLGFALAASVLLGMALACAYVAWRLVAPNAGGSGAGRITTSAALSWAVPVLAILGIGVAAYLSYVEMTQVEAVCGPVGHCNLVQSSAYARLLGIPIALLGAVTYLAIIGLWFVDRLAKQERGKTAARAGLLGLTIFGTLFSIYLTLLELFVIRAVCAWCLASAVIMTLMLLLVARPATRRPELATG